MTTVRLNGRTAAVNNIYCIGRNYVDHIAELNNETPTEPVVFMKPNNSILAGGGTIRLPHYSQSVHYECELVLYIGRDSDGLDDTELMSVIAGYALGLDLTARDVQGRLKEKGLPWTKAKGFRGAACLSDFIDAGRLPEPQNCTFTLAVNGSIRQKGADFPHDLPHCRHFARTGRKLRPQSGRRGLYRYARRRGRPAFGRQAGFRLGRSHAGTFRCGLNRLPAQHKAV